MNVPHPIPYQGSKRNLAEQIIAYFPPDACRLIEPFAGSAALSLAVAAQGKISQFVLNDINAPLVDLWESILNQPDKLASRYQVLWQMQSGRERIFYDAVRTRFNRTHQPHYLLYLLARCVKASIRYNAKGEFNQSPDNRRKGRQPSAMQRDIFSASALLRDNTQLMTGHYRHALKIATPSDIVYLDPPYQGVCANRDPRYIESVIFEDLVDALDDLNRRGINYILSYDGRTGNKKFGQSLPTFLDLTCIELHAGRSSQATLLGRTDKTYESLYLSPKLAPLLGTNERLPLKQLSLFGELA